MRLLSRAVVPVLDDVQVRLDDLEGADLAKLGQERHGRERLRRGRPAQREDEDGLGGGEERRGLLWAGELSGERSVAGSLGRSNARQDRTHLLERFARDAPRLESEHSRLVELDEARPGEGVAHVVEEEDDLAVVAEACREAAAHAQAGAAGLSVWSGVSASAATAMSECKPRKGSEGRTRSSSRKSASVRSFLSPSTST